jgi:putative ABC transport system permease protein
MRTLLRRLVYAITRRRQEEDLAQELEFHRQMKTEELRAKGMTEPDVRARAQREIGNDLLARERSRDVWVAPWLQDITQDLKFGVRMLAKDRRFTLAAVIALGLGIGVNNSVFTIMNAAIFRSLPFEDADRLIEAGLTDGRNDFFSPVAYADYLDWSQSAKSFEGLMANSGATMNLSENGRPAERMRGAYITANTLRLLRVTPFLGRGFVADDERPGAPGTVLISYDLWQGRYGGEPGTIGTVVRINSVPATIVGVMPPRFTYPMAQMWQPISLAPNFNASDRAARTVNVSGRLAAGIDPMRARSELEAIAGQLAQAHPDSHKDLRLRFTRMGDGRVGGRQGWIILGTLMAAVTIVLLIACANVASLLLARSAHRSREIAVRASLGASRWRIIRQLLIECVLIAGAAAVVGLWLSRVFSAQMAQAFNVMEIANPGVTARPYWVDISVDALTLTFVGFVALMVSMLVGLIPAWHLSRTNVNDVLKEGGRAGGGTVRARRMTGGLLIAQLALTVMLLVQAGLLARSYFRLYLTDLGLDTTGVVTMRIVLPVPKYAGVERQRQFMTTLHDRLTAQPIFSSVALGSDIPLHPLGFASRSLAVDGQPWPAGEQPPSVFYVTVGPGYLETLRLPVLRGRGFTSLDGLPGQEGVIVNQRFASKFFPDGSAIGRRVRLTGQNFKPELAPWYTIVGIAPALPNFLPDRGEEPLVYVPTQADPGPQRTISIIVRTADPYLGKAAAAAALRDEVSAIDLDLPVFGILTLDDAAALARTPSLMVGAWFVVISGTALTLAIVGLYALTAHGVAQRAQEIGVRMALGAQAGQVVWLFVRRTVIQLAIGVTLGIGGAVAAGGALSVFQRGTNPRDPLTIGVVCGLLIVVALSASIWPARRAARIDPAVVLKSD